MRSTAFTITWIIVQSAALQALADSVFVGNLERKDAMIRELKGDTLVFEFNGRRSEAQASKVSRIIVTNETPLNGAEEAYSIGKWDEAVDGYQKTIRTTSKPWVKEWAAVRLIDAANKTGRFDAAATAYILTLLKDPTAAATLKPTMPDGKSTFLDTAVTEVNNALKDAKLSADQQRALLGFLIELHQARMDQTAEDAAYEQLARLPGADANDPAAKRVLARRRIGAAQRALESQDYQQALAELEAGKSAFIAPEQQAEALFIIAEARHGLAGADSTALKDAALAYMRVVALAKDEPDRPRVVQSLLKTASILEQLGETQSAGRLYEQVLSQFSDDPSAPKARDALERLKQRQGSGGTG